MAKIDELIAKVQGSEITKTASVSAKGEVVKVASALAEMSVEELEKMAEYVEEKETQETIELAKEADAYGRFMAHGYVGRYMELCGM